MKKLILTLFACIVGLSSAVAAVPDGLYIVGAKQTPTEWQTNQAAYKMQPAGTNTWTFSAPYDGIFSGEWKIQGGDGWGWTFGMGDTFVEGVENDVWFDGQNFSPITATSGTVTVTFTYVAGSDVKDSPTPSKVKYTISSGTTGGGGTTTYPATMNILGNVNGNAFSPDKGVAMTAGANGVFTAKGVNFTAAPDATSSYVNFCEKLASVSTDWNSLGARYGATEKDQAVTSGTSYGVVLDTYGFPNSFMLTPGTYDVTLDLANLTVVFTTSTGGGTVTPEPDPTPGDNTFYLVGEFNEWTLKDSKYAFTSKGNGTYELTIASLNGQFKVNNGAWQDTGGIDLGGDAGGADVKYVDAIIGTNTLWNRSSVNLNADNWTNVTLTLTYPTETENMATLVVSTTGGTVTPEPDPTPGDNTFYLVGAFNDWTLKDSKYAFTEKSSGTYELTIAALNGQFKVNNGAWKGDNGIDLGGDTGGVDVPSIDATEGQNILWNGSTVNLNATNWSNVTLTLTYPTETENMAYLDVSFSGGTITPDPGTYPETLYLQGDTKTNGGFAPNKGMASKGANGVYNWNNVEIVGNNGGAVGYINFATVLGTDSEDWDIAGPNSGNRYGAPTENVPLVSGVASKIKLYAVNVDASGCQSWTLTPGTYNISVNLSAMEITATLVSAPQPEGAEAYLCISNSGTPAFSTAHPLTANANGTFTINYSVNQGDNFNIYVRNDVLPAPASSKQKAPSASDYTAYGPAQNKTLTYTYYDKSFTEKVVKGSTSYWTVSNANVGLAITLDLSKGEMTAATNDFIAPAGDMGYLQADAVNIPLVIDNVTAPTTVTANVPVRLVMKENEQLNYKGFQFNIALPNGFTLTNVTLNSAYNGTVNYKADGDEYEIVAYFDQAANSDDALPNIVTLAIQKEFATLPAVGALTGSATFSKIEFTEADGYPNRAFSGSPFNVTVNVTTTSVAATAVAITGATLERPSYNNLESYNNTKVTYITEGQQVKLTAVVTPENATDMSVTWTTNNPNVTVTNGIVNTAGLNLTAATNLTVTATANGGNNVTATYTFRIDPILLGDANDDDYVTVSDIVTIANYIASENSRVFDFPNANVTKDTEVNGADLTATVNIVMQGSQVPQSVRRNAPAATNDRLVGENYRSNGSEPTAIGVALDNTYNYATLQAIITLPEGMELVEITKGARAAGHQLVYNQRADGRVKVVLYSNTNASFADVEGTLFNIVVKANGASDDLMISQIKGFDSNANTYELTYTGGMSQDTATGVEAINAAEEGVRYFTVDGVEIQNPEAGQIVIRMANGKVEKIVK